MAGISQAELCKRAGIHPTRYTARKNDRSGMSEKSLKKLEAALDELINEKQAAIDEAARS